MYKVMFSKNAKKALQKIDKTQAKLIINWIEKNLAGCVDPRKQGRDIKGSLADWRYRVGNYRVLANIIDDEVIIQIINVGHRKEIYKA